MNFEMIGKLKLGKETEKFKPYQERSFDSGWANRTLMFNAICGDNRHLLTIQGGTFPNKKDYKLIAFGPSGRDDNGNFKQGERLDIPWKDRLIPENIDKVAQNRRFIVDLEEHNRRQKLQKLFDNLHEGAGVTDNDLQSVGLNDEAQVAEALEKSKKKRHEFLSQWDQAEFMKKVLESDKYTDKKFLVRGIIQKQYSEANDRWYESYVPQRIYLADDDANEYSNGTATVYFTNNAIDDTFLEEKGKYFIKAFTFEYDSSRKASIPSPIQMVIENVSNDADDKAKKRVTALVKKFTVEDDHVYEYGVKFDMLNGAQRIEIDESMLTDEQREDLDLGIITMDDIRRDLGSSVYGERVQEYRFTGPARGYTSGRKETSYTEENLQIPKPNDDELFSDEEDELFNEDDDL